MLAKAKKSRLKSKPKRLPRQRQLPGVENNRIASIENAALSYAEVLDARMQLTKRESDLKQQLLTLMHKLHITEYRRNGISVAVVVEQEKVHVKVRQDENEAVAEIYGTVEGGKAQKPLQDLAIAGVKREPDQEEEEQPEEESPERPEEEEEQEEEESQGSNGGPF